MFLYQFSTENRMVSLSGIGLRDIFRVIDVEGSLHWVPGCGGVPLGGHTGAVTSEAADRDPDRISKI